MSLTVVILTYNEAQHIERALASAGAIADRCLVVDSGSTDATVELAEGLGAQVICHPFVNQAQQFNWALTQLPDDTEWVLRLDADEIVSPQLAQEVAGRLGQLPSDVAGLTVPRRMAFLGQPIRYGGVFPVHVLRLFRFGHGRCENRWMDEHICVDGKVEALKGEMLDDNLGTLSWWTQKHNDYASREALAVLLEEREPTGSISQSGGHAGMKRWIKRNVYLRLPSGVRAAAYFLYRYIVRAGFLDGYPGLAFHFLQGFWYRFLVDAKLFEMRRHLAQNGDDLALSCNEVLGIDLAAKVLGELNYEGESEC